MVCSIKSNEIIDTLCSYGFIKKTFSPGVYNFYLNEDDQFWAFNYAEKFDDWRRADKIIISNVSKTLYNQEVVFNGCILYEIKNDEELRNQILLDASYFIAEYKRLKKQILIDKIEKL